MTHARGRIVPVILSGGSGSRLWPLSRESFPKQLLPLAGERPMLQETALRVADRPFHPVVVANAEHRFVIAEQLRQIDRPADHRAGAGRPQHRPGGRRRRADREPQDPEALILVMPADHAVPDARLPGRRRRRAPAAAARAAGAVRHPARQPGHRLRLYPPGGALAGGAAGRRLRREAGPRHRRAAISPAAAIPGTAASSCCRPRR